MVSKNQFGFMPGRSTTKAIHLLRSLMKKYRERQRDLHIAFLDLEKAYDSVPHKLIWSTIIDRETPRRYLKVIKDMHEGDKTRVRTTVRNIEFFLVEVELEEGLNNRLESWNETLEDNGPHCGKTMLDMIPNEIFKAILEVETIIYKMREGRLRWFDHVKRRPQTAPGMRGETKLELVGRMARFVCGYELAPFRLSRSLVASLCPL
nr:isoleucine--tRNA ligase [Tanacetum cinerariifolium]